MEIINEAEYRKRIKNGLSGAFLFFGDEDYLKAYAVKATREAVCPDDGFGCFNDVTIDFPEFSISSLLATLEAPPMMADKKLVVLKSFNFNAIKPSEVEAMVKIFESYGKDKYNVLIVSVIPGGIDMGYSVKKPSALLKKIADNATAVYFETSNASKLTVWVARHFEHEGIHVSERVARYLVDYCGSGMMELSAEIRKLCLYLRSKGRDIVTEEDVRYISVPATDSEPFALTNAAMAGNRAEALKALENEKFRQVKPEIIMAEISAMYSHMYLTKLLKEQGLSIPDIVKTLKAYKIHEFKIELYLGAVEKIPLEKLRRSLELCLDTDLAMKTYGKRNYEQIEKLICLL